MKKELEILKEKFIHAKTEKEKELIDVEMKKLAEKNGESFANSMLEMVRETANRAEELVVKEKLQSVLPIISVSYFAKNYFNKSRHWLYQRINGNIVNGKPAKFNENEIKILNSALQDVSKKIGSVVLQ
ncbi:MAG: DUF5053 domain-containing protein [Flavobacteriaceae bacterium]|jgi:hypothetical protein|nr:DUF5053 domain-containing protein [Flavobacteriaceae bacterium]